MDMDEASEQRPAVFGVDQGWVVVIVVMLSLAVASGGRFLFGVVLKPVTEEFGWGRAELSLAVTINVALLSLLQPAIGLLADRFGSRRVLLGGIVAVALAMIPMTLASRLWQIYVFYGLFASVGFAATSPVNTTALVSGWFEKKRGLALSLATSGSAYGQLLIVPIATAIMIGWGWRAAYWAIAVALAVVVLPLAFLSVRDAPGRVSMRARRAGGERVVSLRQAIRTPSYWQLSLGMFACGYSMSFASVHMIPYLTDMPQQSANTMRTTASLALAVVGACSIIGAVVLGVIADRRGHRQILALTYALRGLSFLVLLAAGSWIPGIFLAAVILGISWTSTTPLAAAITADIYGRASLGTIFGFVFTAMNIGTAAGAWLAGLDRDLAGNYQLSLLANIALGFAAAGATLAIRVRPFEARESERRAVATAAGD